MSAAPELVWLNRQRAVSTRQLRLPAAAEAVRSAWPDIAAAKRKGSVLDRLPEICLVLVSDARIAALHDEFMRDPAPTDVITFHHGEIVISAETARREARARGLPLPAEIARYAVHGLLHLAGWSDADPGAASDMRIMQEKILRRALRGLC
jgi:probable rRNA maturation factor